VHKINFLLICFKSAAGNNSLLLFSKVGSSMLCLCLRLCLAFVLWPRT
jgi:hypothetical protein